MLCHCVLKNVVDVSDEDETAYQRRFGADFAGPLILFGAEINYLPITDEDKARCHQLGSKVLSGIFLGYDQKAGGGWSGDLLVADWDQMKIAEHFSDMFKGSRQTKSKSSRLVKIVGFPQLEIA